MDFFCYGNQEATIIRISPGLVSMFIHASFVYFCIAVWEAVVQRCKKGVLRDFAKFTGKHLWQDLFLNACDFIKKEAVTQMFFLNFAKFLRTSFLTKHLRWLLQWFLFMFLLVFLFF